MNIKLPYLLFFASFPLRENYLKYRTYELRSTEEVSLVPLILPLKSELTPRRNKKLLLFILPPVSSKSSRTPTIGTSYENSEDYKKKWCLPPSSQMEIRIRQQPAVKEGINRVVGHAICRMNYVIIACTLREKDDNE